MAKFMNKKEQVYDFRLTSYGNYLLAINKFRPTYYAFFDQNIVYDMEYANTGVSGLRAHKEAQNEISYRIKENSPYLEGMLLYENIEQNVDIIGENYYEVNRTAVQEKPAFDAFKFYTSIGDSYLDGNPEFAPAWKIISLYNDITSSSHADDYSQTFIPQINIVSTYSKRVVSPGQPPELQTAEQVIGSSDLFADGTSIHLIARAPLIYAEEVNTQLLTNNFEIEVFELEDVSAPTHASGSIIFSDNPSAGETLQIGDGNGSPITLTFVAAGSTPGTDEVELGTGTNATADTLASLVNTIAQYESTGIPIGPLSKNIDIGVTYWEILVASDPASSNHISLRNNVVGLGGNSAAYGGNAVLETDSSAIELVGFLGGTDLERNLKRKLFNKTKPHIIDGLMIASRPTSIEPPALNTGSVNYYFDLRVDTEITTAQACKAAQEYNKESYYIDLDFDCKAVMAEKPQLHYDIYGRVTEPDECLD
jgi:hypothetical protein